MKKTTGFILVIIVGVLLVVGYLLINRNSEPDTSQFDKNSVSEFEFSYSTTEKEMVVDCKFPSPKIDTNSGMISITGLPNGMAGYRLPSRNFVLALPKDTDISEISLEYNETLQAKNVFLKKAKLGKSSKTEGQPLDKTSGKNVNYSVQEKDGCKFVVFTIYPCEYLENKKVLNFYPELSIKVILKEKAWNTNEINQETIDYLKEKVENPEMVDTYGLK